MNHVKKFFINCALQVFFSALFGSWVSWLLKFAAIWVLTAILFYATNARFTQWWDAVIAGLCLFAIRRVPKF